MKKINRQIIVLFSAFICTYGHAQDFIMAEIVAPDSIYFCKTPTVVVKALVRGYISDSFRISYQLGNRPRVEEVVPRPNNVPTDSVLYTFRTPLIVPDSLKDTLRVTILTPDFSPNNNSLFFILQNGPIYTLPFTENFEQTRFPPLNWSATPVGYYDAGWTKARASLVGLDGQPTAAIYFNEAIEQRNGISPPERNFATIMLPAIDLKRQKNPYISFDLGLPYEPFITFNVEISTDCGANFKTIYTQEGKYGAYLGTPRSADWLRDSISLIPYIDSTVLIRFRAKHGNKDGTIVGTYLDNIRVFDAPIPQKDASINRILTPTRGAFCPSKSEFPVVIEVRNTGLAVLDTFIVSYQMANTPSVSDTIFRTLAFNQTFVYTFSKRAEISETGVISLSVAVKTRGDGDVRNDVLVLKDAVSPRYNLTYTENFESPYFPPTNFPFGTGGTYWWYGRKLVTGRDGTVSNAPYSPYSQYTPRIQMILPYVDLRRNNRPFLTFDVAYPTLDPVILATTARKEDSLRVQISTDCGASFTTLYEKRGNKLTSSPTIVSLSQGEWMPNNPTDWRRDTVDLTYYKDSIVLIRFINLMGAYSPVFMDNFKIEEGYAYDMGIIERLKPATTLICARDRNALPVRVVVQNNAFLTADSAQLSYQLDTEGPVSEKLTRRILPRDTVHFQFRQLMNVAATGKHNLTIFITYFNDENVKNDTLKTTFTVGNDYTPNLLEDFETAAYPPLDWQWKLTKTRGWDRLLTVGKNNQLSVVAAANLYYDQTEAGAVESLISYPVNLDNTDKPLLIFDRFSPYLSGDFYNDSLRIDISTDCGITYQSTSYVKTGAVLSTTTSFNPRPSTGADWRTDTMDLSAFRNKNIQVRFSRIARTSGGSVLLDNVRFIAILPKNLSLISLINPVDTTPLCPDNPFILAFNIRNDGTQRIDSFNIKYQIDNQAEATERVGLTLQPNSLMSYKMPLLLRGLAAGQYKLRVNVQLAGDTENGSDTLFQTIRVQNRLKLPFFESFNAPSSFPPVGWIVQPSSLNSWKKATVINKYGDATPAAYFNNLNNKSLKDGLLTPPIDLKNAAKPRLLFDVACARFSNASNDSLRVEISTDCGLNYKQIYLKSGTALATASNWASPIQWLPTAFLWRTDSVDLAAYVDSFVLVRFVNIGSNGHQLYLDDIRVADSSAIVTTKEVVADASFSTIYPNPTTGDVVISIDHPTNEPTTLQLINVQGQLVKQEIKSSWDTTQYKWSLSDLPVGVYVLHINNGTRLAQHRLILIK